jgi:hypothetical protein
MKTIVCLLLALMLLPGTRPAELLKVGDSIPKFVAKDQHGVTYEFKPITRVLFIAFEMSTGKEANRVLEKKGATFLHDAKAVFISNIHGMPAIGRAFALPKMRKYPHRIILADEEKLLDPFPKQKDRVTVLTLDSNIKIKSIKFWDPEKEPIEETLH